MRNTSPQNKYIPNLLIQCSQLEQQLLLLISPPTIFYHQWAEICVGQANMKGNTYPLKQFVKNLFSCLHVRIQILFHIHKGMYCNFLALLLFRKLSFPSPPVPCFGHQLLVVFLITPKLFLPALPLQDILFQILFLYVLFSHALQTHQVCRKSILRVQNSHYHL